MGQNGSRIGEEADGLASFLNWIPIFGRTEGIVDLATAKSRCGNPLRAASRYHSCRSISEDYEIDVSRVLGSGMTGDVKLCRHRLDPDREYAVKTYIKCSEGATGHHFDLLRTEAEIYLTLDHPNIARLHDVYEEAHSISLVMEYCSGGELLQQLRERQTQFTEKEAAETTRQMLLAVNYLHAHSVVHRDLKLENFLYQNVTSSGKSSQLKLIDFGFATYWDPSTRMLERCGSLDYVSPDVLSGHGYTNRCDCWGLGVISFMLLSGYPPFRGEAKDLIKRIRDGTPEWREPRWRHVSKVGRDFVQRLLRKNPAKRMTAQEALNHPWMQQGTQSCEHLLLSPSTLQSLKIYAEAPRLRRAALQLVAQEIPDSEVEELRQAFFALDVNHRGTIYLSDLVAALPNDITIEGVDASYDGQIDYTDFVAATTAAWLDQANYEFAVQVSWRRFDAARSTGSMKTIDLQAVLGEAAFEDPKQRAVLQGLHCEQFEALVQGRLDCVTGDIQPKAKDGSTCCKVEACLADNRGAVYSPSDSLIDHWKSFLTTQCH